MLGRFVEVSARRLLRSMAAAAKTPMAITFGERGAILDYFAAEANIGVGVSTRAA